MASLQTVLDITVMALLVATLFHAVRLERALHGLKRDRGALDALLGTFGSSTREAEAGIEKLRGLTETAAGQLARQAELGTALKDDLSFLIDRGDRLADRMDVLVRIARPVAAEPARAVHESAEQNSAGSARSDDAPRVRSQAERDLLHALRATR